MLEQFAGVITIAGRERNANTGPNDDLVAFDLVRRRNFLQQAIGQDNGPLSLPAGHTLHQNEFIAAETRDNVDIVPRALPQPRCHLFKQRIAGRMAQRVVHRLEQIKIQRKHRKHTATVALGGKFLVDPFKQMKAVRKSGQRIVASHKTRFAPQRACAP